MPNYNNISSTFYDGAYSTGQYNFGTLTNHHVIYTFTDPQSIVQILANGPHDEGTYYWGGIDVMKIYYSGMECCVSVL